VGNPDLIQNRINNSKAKLDELNKSIQEGSPVSPEEVAAAHNEYNAANAEYEKVKNAAESQIGTAKPNALQLKINKNQEKINSINNALEEKAPQFEQRKPNEPENIAPHEKNIEQAVELHQQAKSALDRTENEIDRHLNEGEHHEVSASREMKKDISSINNYWSGEYKDLMKNLRDTNFHLANPDRLERIQAAIEDGKTEYGGDPTGEFAEVLRHAPKFGETNAADFMAKQKDFRDARYNLLQAAKTEPSAVKRTEMFRAYQALEPFEKLINEALEEGLGEHKSRYQYINNGYRTQVFPLRENGIASSIMEGKPLSSDIAKQLAGDQEGQALLREIAKRNPETLRNIVGQQKRDEV